MAKTVVVDGKLFISEESLVTAMVKECVRYTHTDDLEVCESESTMTSTFQRLLKQMDLKTTEKAFRDNYVRERFIERTLGV